MLRAMLILQSYVRPQSNQSIKQMVGGLMQAAAGGPPSQRAALGLLLSQAKAEVLKEVHAGVVKAVNPLAGAEDDHARTGAVAERLLAAAVASAPDPAFRAWVEGLWAEAGLGIANDDL